VHIEIADFLDYMRDKGLIPHSLPPTFVASLTKKESAATHTDRAKSCKSESTPPKRETGPNEAASTTVVLQNPWPALTESQQRHTKGATKGRSEIYIDVCEGFCTQITPGADGTTTVSHHAVGEISIKSALKIDEPIFTLGQQFPNHKKFDFIFNAATEVKKIIEADRGPKTTLTYRHRPREGKSTLVKYHSRDAADSLELPGMTAQWTRTSTDRQYSVVVTLDARRWQKLSEMSAIVIKVPLPGGVRAVVSQTPKGSTKNGENKPEGPTYARRLCACTCVRVHTWVFPCALSSLAPRP
jgi:hypothetical protein